jgi:hypothetical protein
MKKVQMDAVINGIGFFLLRLTLAAFGFAFWFIILSWIGSPLAGVVVGTISALLALILSTPKREQCDNVSTRLAGTYADDQRRNGSFTNSNGHHYSENPIKSNPFPIKDGSNSTNTNLKRRSS